MPSAMAIATAPSNSGSSTHASTDVPHFTKPTDYPKTDVKINLRDHYSSKIYTSSSPVAGDVTITTRRDVHFDSIQIVLIGNTKATFDGMGFPQEVTHTFLKMVMPIPESTYPVPRVLETGRTYTVPFNFVIPNQLTINACNHQRLSEQLQDHHVLLPPSLGGFQKDDMAPRMAQVEYVIKARVLREPVLGGKKTRIVEATQQIQVLPASPEEPPLNITENDKLYNMSKTKAIRKTFLGTKVGRLTATAHQPGAAVVAADGSRLVTKPVARISLTYDPESPTMPPPQITSITGKITSHTYYSSGTISSFPNLGMWHQPFILDRRGQFFTSAALPSMTAPAEQPAWKQNIRPATRRDSGYGSESSDSPNDKDAAKTKKEKQKNKSKSPVFLTTTLDVPLDLPTEKRMFVPTFHSCIASRVYTLTLSIGVSTKGASGQVSLIMPLQIAVEAPASGGAGATEGLPTFEEAEADDHLRPRVLQVPTEVPTGRASWGPHITNEAVPSYVEGYGGGNEPGAAAPVVVGDELPEYADVGRRRRD